MERSFGRLEAETPPPFAKSLRAGRMTVLVASSEAQKAQEKLKSNGVVQIQKQRHGDQVKRSVNLVG